MNNGEKKASNVIKRHLNIDYGQHGRRWLSSSISAKSTTGHSEFGPIAPQFIDPNDFLLSPLLAAKQDENCLNLNIYAPTITTQKKLPVMVWIHGGGFISGANSLPMYDGAKLAEATNTVVVSINYRLGALGFLRLTDVTDGVITSHGNEGLEDQITALTWIQQHIEQYSGDRHQVTLFGESAGAMSIACLLVMPTAKGLFHRAILQSGAGHTFATKAQANEVAKAFLVSAKSLGFSPEQLLSLSTSQIAAIQGHFLAQPQNYQRFGIIPFKPVLDEQTLPLAPYEAITQGCAVDIPIICGSNTDEWTLFAAMLKQNIQDPQIVDQWLISLVGQQQLNEVKQLMTKQCQQRDIEPTPQNLLNETLTQFWFTQPAYRLVKAQTQAGGQAYQYSLARKTVIPGFGCTHVTDIGFIFAHTSAAFHGQEPRVEQLIREFQSTWGQFAHSSIPTHPDIIWPNSNINAPQHLLFGHENSSIEPNDLQSSECWSQISDQQLAGV